MHTINRTFTLGHLGHSPEVRQTAGGVAVANFDIATTERFKRGDEWAEKTEWHRVVCFGRTAEVARDMLGKGDPVFVEGRLQHREWEDKSGQKRKTTEIVADKLILLREKPKAAAGDMGESLAPLGDDNELPFE